MSYIRKHKKTNSKRRQQLKSKLVKAASEPTPNTITPTTLYIHLTNYLKSPKTHLTTLCHHLVAACYNHTIITSKERNKYTKI